MNCLGSHRWLFVITAFLTLNATIHAAQKKHLNVIVILADDLGYGELGCYGHAKFKTLHLDALAKAGARLNHYYTPVPFCAPTRGSLLTGRYPLRNGLTRNPCPKEDPASNGRADDVHLPASEITLAQLFKEAGYATCCIGKWHLGHYQQFLPRQRGFDNYYGIPYSNDMHKVVLLEGNKVVEYPVVQATLTKRYTERALQFVLQNRNHPFFLYLAHAMPHKPLACSDAFYKKSGVGLYGDVIMELDWSVGQIMAQLRRLNLDDNTLVIFTSDNGPWYGGSTGGLRGMKGNNWEGGVRVPFIAHLPGRIPAGHVSNEPAIIADIFPTALKAAGIALPKNRVFDGKDIMPLLTSKKAKSPHKAIFTSRGDKICSVRQGKWKLYLINPGRPAKRGNDWIDPRRPDGVRLLAPYEQSRPSEYPGVLTGDNFAKMGLFDLDADRSEQRNVIADNPQVARRLQALAREFVKSLEK